MGQVSFQPQNLNTLKSFIKKEPITYEKREIFSKISEKLISEKLFIDKPLKSFIKEEPINDIFGRTPQIEKIEKLTFKEKSSALLKELNTFVEKRFNSAPVSAPAPAHVPGNSSDYAAQLSDAEAAFLQSHGVKTPAAGIAQYEAPKPATRAGI